MLDPLRSTGRVSTAASTVPTTRTVRRPGDQAPYAKHPVSMTHGAASFPRKTISIARAAWFSRPASGEGHR